MRDYEMTVIVSPEVGDDNLGTVVEKVNRFIASTGGETAKVDTWGRRRLAYHIGNHREGYYFITKFKMDPQATTELERSIKLSEEIIRHLIVRLGE